MVPKWRPEMTKSSKWLPKRLFGEKGCILTPLGGTWELNEVIFRSFGIHLWTKIAKKTTSKSCAKISVEKVVKMCTTTQAKSWENRFKIRLLLIFLKLAKP